MLKKLMIGTALGAITLSSALAQSNPGTSSPSSPPVTQSDSTSSSSMSHQTRTTAGDKVIASQSSSQFLASKFQGIDVVGTDDKKIGDVNDVLFDQQGKIEAYVVGVGGFLGIGSKNVALAPSAFQVVKGDTISSDKLKLSMSREELQSAAAFEPYKEPARTTTGSGLGSSPSGLGGTRPSSNSGPVSR